MEFPNARIIVFAKAPEPGKVKTRLIPALGADGACQLHQQLTRHVLQTASSAKFCPVELWCAPDCEHAFFKQCRDEFDVSLHTQQGEGLGERMGHALAMALQQSQQVLIIGADCPALTRQDLHQALSALSSDQDAVLSPAEDGGYVLLGLSRFAPALFTDIDWGTPQVMAQQRLRLKALGWQWQELSQRWDVDRPEDLPRLQTLSVPISH